MVQPLNELGKEAVEENRGIRRDQHTQRLTTADAKLPERFTSCQFIGYADPTTFKVDKFGTVSIAFKAPRQWADDLLPLLNSGGAILSVDVQRWNVVPVDPDEEDDDE